MLQNTHSCIIARCSSVTSPHLQGPASLSQPSWSNRRRWWEEEPCFPLILSTWLQELKAGVAALVWHPASRKYTREDFCWQTRNQQSSGLTNTKHTAQDSQSIPMWRGLCWRGQTCDHLHLLRGTRMASSDPALQEPSPLNAETTAMCVPSHSRHIACSFSCHRTLHFFPLASENNSGYAQAWHLPFSSATCGVSHHIVFATRAST